jgi:hypothetical protein
MAIRIICINKANGLHENPYVAISHLGWEDSTSGKSGRNTREEIYSFIKEQGGEAYVQAGNARAEVITAVSSRGTRYVKTRADSTDRDNLLKLPECR